MMAEKGLAKHEGQWIPLEEKERLENEAKGLVKFEDNWITPDERDKIIAQREAEKKAAEEAEAKEAEEKKKEEEKEPANETGDTSEDEKDDDIPFGDLVEEEGTSNDESGIQEPEIEDLTEKKDEEKTKTQIDYTKTSKKDKDKIENPEISTQFFGRIFLPVMIGLAIIMIVIVFVSSKKTSRK